MYGVFFSNTLYICTYICVNMFTCIYVYICINHTWKKSWHPGNWLPSLYAKNDVILPKSTKIQRKIRRISKVKFFGCRHFWFFFQVYICDMYVVCMNFSVWINVWMYIFLKYKCVFLSFWFFFCLTEVCHSNCNH